MGNQSWHVYVYGEKETYPYVRDEKRLYLVYDYILDEVYLCEFNKRGTCFTDTHTGEIRGMDNPVFWAYVPYLPKNFETITFYKCTRKKSCEFEDDGYCFDMPKGMKCRYRKKCIKYIPKEK